MESITDMGLDIVEASGSWRAIGKAEGRAQRPAVKYTVYCYANYHAGSKEIGLLDRVTEQVRDFLTDRFPQEWDELCGIAEGAEIELPLLVAANFPAALARVAGAPPPEVPAAMRECSVLLFPGSEWGPLVGGTLDDPPLRFFLRGRPDDGIPFLCVMWPGWVACTWGGMNAAGLALCGAGAGPLRPENQQPEHRTHGLDMLPPQRVVLRSCRTVEEAIRRLSEPDMSSHGICLALLDASGRGALARGYLNRDQYTLRVDELPADRGLCCGNFLSDEIGPEDYANFPAQEAAFRRYAGLRRGVEDNIGKYSVKAMSRVLTGHDDDPAKGYSVCNRNTILAMIAAPTSGRYQFACRPPCVRGFRDYAI